MFDLKDIDSLPKDPEILLKLIRDIAYENNTISDENKIITEENKIKSQEN